MRRRFWNEPFPGRHRAKAPPPIPIERAAVRQYRCRAARSTSYSTVTLFARLRGWSTLQPRMRATSRASSCNGTLAVMALKQSRTGGIEMIWPAIFAMSSSPSVASAMIVAPRASHSLRFETTLSYVGLLVATAITGNPGSISAMGPCFISPAA